MELGDGIKFLNETRNSSNKAEQTASSENEQNIYNEDICDFRLDPIGFEEVTSQVMERVDDVFDLTTRCSRFAPQFLIHCAQLEAGIRYLAGAALTKAAFLDKKRKFPKLEQLSLNKLYMMTSWTFRKINAALDEEKKKSGTVTPGLWKAMLRTLSLLNRLKASEGQIYNRYRKAFWSDRRVAWEKMLTSESYNRDYTRQNIQTPVFRQSPAFSPLRGTAETIEMISEPEQENKEQSPIISYQEPDLPVQEAPVVSDRSHQIEIIPDSSSKAELSCGVGGGCPEDENQNSGCSFDEMRGLLQDPKFLMREPELAAAFREILSMLDSS